MPKKKICWECRRLLAGRYTRRGFIEHDAIRAGRSVRVVHPCCDDCLAAAEAEGEHVDSCPS